MCAGMCLCGWLSYRVDEVMNFVINEMDYEDRNASLHTRASRGLKP